MAFQDQSNGHQVTVTTGTGRYRTEIEMGKHHLLADEPIDSGGTDAGASPYRILSGALGACIAITLRMYADRKEWPLEKISIGVSHGKIPASECEDCETKLGKVDRFYLELELTGDLDEEQRNRLHQIACRCPVHRTLHSEVSVGIDLKPA